jgi:hypothetical protein
MGTLYLFASKWNRDTALHFLPEFLEAVRLRSQGGVLPLRRLSLCHQRFNAHNMLALLRDCSLECLECHGCVISKGAFATDDFAVQNVAQCFARNKTLLGLAIDFANEHDHCRDAGKHMSKTTDDW